MPEIEVDTLIFDIDDTMYPMSSGFSDHRNGEVICQFMLDELGFESATAAKELRDFYFQKYHSTMKGLNIATKEGKLPKPFNQDDLGAYWAAHCDFAKYVKPNAALADALKELRDAGLQLVAFTNSPRAYGLRCLDSIGVRDFFPDDRVFAVEDVLPACKPEPEAFAKVLRAVGTVPERAVMFEDSMKNVRACKGLGMWTVLIDESAGGAIGGEAALLGDVPCAADPAVDATLQRIDQLRSVLPGLWKKRFEPLPKTKPA